MKYIEKKLSRQLLSLIGIIFAFVFISLGIVLPKFLLSVSESSMYTYLSEPLKVISSDIDHKLLNTKIAYLYIVDDNIVLNDNFNTLKDIDNPNKIIPKIKKQYGKFIYNHKLYYYYKIENDNGIKIAISDDSYINEKRNEIIKAIFPIVLLTCTLIGLTLVIWISIIVKKIEKLKLKIDNIDNLDFPHSIDFTTDDEIKSLALALEDMRISLINQEKYRNRMYQNISHDFKTPLTVIKSYIEAVHDGVEDKDTALKVIDEQTQKLDQKVRSLLYLNKLDYLKDTKNITIEQVDMKKILEEEIEKFKFHRKDISFTLEIDKKSKYYGTYEHWETVLDNLLSNFMRYAKTSIKITAKQNKIVLYNDGERIDDDFIERIFIPFRKGIKGEFGLGLSIVKKTLNLIDYDITIKNHKKGVSFIINKETHK
ncbi:MAG: HAMP domain-containing histidine kinase [Bacilli bacterium]|nr:HAMP domain-containing histidine kinase [Bacilli bacterium]